MQSQAWFGLFALATVAAGGLAVAQEPPKGFVSEEEYKVLEKRYTDLIVAHANREEVKRADGLEAKLAERDSQIASLQGQLRDKSGGGGFGFFFAGGILGGGAGLAAGLFYRMHHKDDWKALPPTERQLEYADSLGIYRPESYSRGDLSELIDHAKQQQGRV